MNDSTSARCYVMQVPRPIFPTKDATWACAAALIISLAAVPPSLAARDKLPPVSSDPNRCSLSALDKFAETRAIFSQEASSGMDEVCSVSTTRVQCMRWNQYSMCQNAKWCVGVRGCTEL